MVKYIHHKKYLLPFYDCYLKGKRTSYLDEPEVRYFVTGAERFENAPSWPPQNSRYVPYYLGAGPTGSVTSLNDGALSTAALHASRIAIASSRVSSRARPSTSACSG